MRKLDMEWDFGLENWVRKKSKLREARDHKIKEKNRGKNERRSKQPYKRERKDWIDEDLQ